MAYVAEAIMLNKIKNKKIFNNENIFYFVII